VKNDRVMVALSSVPIVAVVVMAAIALVASNSSRADAQRSADEAAAQVVEVQAQMAKMQAQADCMNDLASGESSANTDALIGLVRFVRELSTPAGNPAVVDWDGILARVAEARAKQEAADLNCPNN